MTARRHGLNSVWTLTRSARRAGSDAGFSVLELIVALAIVSLAMLSVPQLIELSKRGQQTERQLEAAQSDAAGLRFIRHRLEAARPVWFGARSATRPVFEGSPARLTFVAPLPDASPSAGLSRMTLGLEPNGDSPAQAGALSVRLAAFNPAETAEEIDGPPTRLIGGVQSVRFRYFGTLADTSTEKSWQDAWIRRESLPDLIEITIMRASKSDPLRIVVAPRAKRRS